MWNEGLQKEILEEFVSFTGYGIGYLWCWMAEQEEASRLSCAWKYWKTSKIPTVKVKQNTRTANRLRELRKDPEFKAAELRKNNERRRVQRIMGYAENGMIDKNCVQCGGPMILSHRNPQKNKQKYCTKACQKAALKPRMVVGKLSCRYCGVEIFRSGSNIPTYCSRRCNGFHKRAQKKEAAVE